MDNTRVELIIDQIEELFRELQKETGSIHISAYMIRQNFSITDYTNLANPKFDHYTEGKYE
jgi:hypothetical protein